MWHTADISEQGVGAANRDEDTGSDLVSLLTGIVLTTDALLAKLGNRNSARPGLHAIREAARRGLQSTRRQLPPLGGERVLVVDRDGLTLMGFQAALAQFGVMGRVARTREEAREVLEESRDTVGLVLVDDAVGECSGADVASQIAVANPSVEVVLMASPCRLPALANWSGEVVTRPKSPADLLGILAHHL